MGYLRLISHYLQQARLLRLLHLMVILYLNLYFYVHFLFLGFLIFLFIADNHSMAARRGINQLLSMKLHFKSSVSYAIFSQGYLFGHYFDRRWLLRLSFPQSGNKNYISFKICQLWLLRNLHFFTTSWCMLEESDLSLDLWGNVAFLVLILNS